MRENERTSESRENSAEREVALPIVHLSNHFSLAVSKSLVFLKQHNPKLINHWTSGSAPTFIDISLVKERVRERENGCVRERERQRGWSLLVITFNKLLANSLWYWSYFEQPQTIKIDNVNLTNSRHVGLVEGSFATNLLNSTNLGKSG